jgi:hypothetical protein
MVGQQLDVDTGELGIISTSDGSLSGAAPDEGSNGQRSPAAGTDHRVAGASRAASVRAWLAVGRRRTITGWVVLALLFVPYVALAGFPTSEDEVLIWLSACLFVSSLGDLSRWRRGVLRDWLPLYAILAVYALLRGYASHVLWGPFVRPQVAFDEFIGGGTAPTVLLQRWLFTSHLHPWDYAAWAVYTSHFFVSFIVAAVLWKRDYPAFKRFVPLFVGLTFVGYIGYALYPAVPPWLASQTGHLQGTVRIIPLVWDHLGVRSAAALFTHGSTFANNIAAMPSLHAAYPMLLCLFFWPRARRWVRVLLVSYVLAMAFTLVYTAEHFVIDELVGWLCAIAVYFVGSRLLDWHQAGGWRRLRGKNPLPAAASTMDASSAHAPTMAADGTGPGIRGEDPARALEGGTPDNRE